MVTIYFATNREVSGTDSNPTFGERFNKAGPRFYRVGKASVSRSDSVNPDELYKIDSIHLAAESKQGAPRKLGSTELFSELQAKVRTNEKDVIVYLHGFANTFESSIHRAAQISDAYEITGKGGQAYNPYVFAFAWPSNGAVQPPWQYFSDRSDAEDSGKAVARALLRVRDFLADIEAGEDDGFETRVRCGRRLHLVVHSMGNWALRHAVQELRSEIGSGSLQPIFENALLMAADEDDDALEPDKRDKLALLTRLARRVHVYHSCDDLALVVSDKTKFNRDRLGFNGPRTFSGLSTRITAVDCTEVDRTKFTHGNHQYYRLRSEVIEDVKAILSGERPDRVPGREVIEPGRRYRLKMKKPPGEEGAI